MVPPPLPSQPPPIDKQKWDSLLRVPSTGTSGPLNPPSLTRAMPSESSSPCISMSTTPYGTPRGGLVSVTGSPNGTLRRNSHVRGKPVIYTQTPGHSQEV